jgi:O-antigen/teichoic acid export membrane protein
MPALTLLDQVVVSAANFLLLVAVARSCSISEVGLFVLGLRIVDVLAELHNALIWAPYTVFSPDFSADEKRLYSGSVFVHQVVSCTVSACVVGVVGGLVHFVWGQSDIGGVLMAVVPASIFMLLREFLRRFCFASFDMLTALTLDAGVFVLQACGVYILYTTNAISPKHTLLVLAMACCCGVCAVLALHRRHFVIAPRRVILDLRRNLAYGRWLLGADLTLLLSNQVYPWLLAAIAGPAALGVFASCQALTNFARMFLIAALNLLGPKCAHAYANAAMGDLQRIVARSTALLAGGTACFCVLTFLAGGRALAVIYGGQFSQLGHLVSALSLGLLATALTLPATCALSAMRRADMNLLVNVITLGIHVTVGAFLVYKFEAIGAAYGLLFGGVIAWSTRSLAYRQIVTKPQF